MRLSVRFLGKPFVRLATTLSLYAGLGWVAAAATPSSLSRPNIILIVADDLGYGQIGAYGQRQIQTPTLDQLAAEGIRFTNFYAGGASDAPSRASALTGLHAGHTRIRVNGTQPLAPEDLTIAEVLQAQGYVTAAFGKWGLGEAGSTGVPNQQGFKEWLGFLNLTHAEEHYPELLFRNALPLQVAKNVEGKQGLFADDFFTQASLNFIRDNQTNAFFLYLAYNSPHPKWQVPSLEPYVAKDWSETNKTVAAMITRLDTNIGRILARLKELKLAENTLILFTSDNGPQAVAGFSPEFFQSTAGLRGLKGDLYEGGLRVPLIAHWPGQIKAGQVSDQVAAGWDLFPTLAEIGGVNLKKEQFATDGISFLPALQGKRAKSSDYLYWESHENGLAQAIRQDDWKAIRRADGSVELYDLKKDPTEQVNVAGKNGRVVNRLTKLMD